MLKCERGGQSSGRADKLSGLQIEFGAQNSPAYSASLARVRSIQFGRCFGVCICLSEKKQKQRQKERTAKRTKKQNKSKSMRREEEKGNEKENENTFCATNKAKVHLRVCLWADNFERAPEVLC